MEKVGSPKLAAVIWHQGEADATDPDYLKRLAVVVNALREKTGQPDLLFIAGEVYEKPVEKIRMMSKSIPNTAPF